MENLKHYQQGVNPDVVRSMPEEHLDSTPDPNEQMCLDVLAGIVAQNIDGAPERLLAAAASKERPGAYVCGMDGCNVATPDLDDRGSFIGCPKLASTN